MGSGFKKILVITTWFPNNQEPSKCIFNKNIVEAQFKYNDCSITIISPIPHLPGLKLSFVPKRFKRYINLPYKEITDSYRIFRPKYFKLPGVLSSKIDWIAYLKAVKRVIEKENIDFDIIHTHGLFPDSYVGALVSDIYKKPLVVHLHDSYIKDIYKKHSKKIDFTFKQASALVPVSEFQSKMIQDMSKSDVKGKTAVVYNGIDISSFSIDRDVSESESTKKIIFIGGNYKGKGLDTLLNAISLIKDKSDLKLDIYGGKLNDKEFLDLVDALQIKNNVCFKGVLPNNHLAELIPTYSFLVLPSIYETFGIVLIEAMACGLPVISTRITAIPEIVSNEDVGLLVEPNNPKELALAIEKALTKKWDRQYISKFAKKFSIQNQAINIDNVYSKILQ